MLQVGFPRNLTAAEPLSCQISVAIDGFQVLSIVENTHKYMTKSHFQHSIFLTGALFALFLVNPPSGVTHPLTIVRRKELKLITKNQKI